MSLTRFSFLQPARQHLQRCYARPLLKNSSITKRCFVISNGCEKSGLNFYVESVFLVLLLSSAGKRGFLISGLASLRSPIPFGSSFARNKNAVAFFLFCFLPAYTAEKKQRTEIVTVMATTIKWSPLSIWVILVNTIFPLSLFKGKFTTLQYLTNLIVDVGIF